MNIYFMYKITLVNYCEILKVTQRLLAVGNSCAIMNCWNIESYLAKTWQVCWLCWNRKIFKLEKMFRRYIQVYIYYRKKTEWQFGLIKLRSGYSFPLLSCLRFFELILFLQKKKNQSEAPTPLPPPQPPQYVEPRIPSRACSCCGVPARLRKCCWEKALAGVAEWHNDFLII